MSNTNFNKDIYEMDGVYGDADKFAPNANRLQHMLAFITKLEKTPREILDIGCGTGHLANEIKKIYPNANITGIDISKKAIAIGKKAYKQITLLQGDAEKNLPFASACFDLVISGEHIEHLQDPDTYLSEINRILKKDGILLLTTPNLGYWVSRILLLFGRQPYYLEPSLRKTLPIVSFGKKSFPENLDILPSGHLRLYTFDMLKKLLNAYGFTTLDAKGSYMLKNFPFKQLDHFFANFPSLSFGLILKVKKNYE
ncbi:MAG TPA: class I SAM-dependent methyltransferase [Candidatus Saccharimonadales bacterium]|nr:class I SAM-dependent methyltransferase [Candidatus Saccharimonadales bacterium]